MTASSITFAVVGHDEAATLEHALRQTAVAQQPGDDLVFVDSASSDDSVGIAAACGVPVVAAPLGKGNAIRALLEKVSTPWVCLLDADIFYSERPIAETLAQAVRADPEAGLVLGQFHEPDVREVLSSTWHVFQPLMDRFFPASARSFGTRPLTGFRAVRPDLLNPFEDVPPDFGVEAHIDIEAGESGRRIHVVELGAYKGRFLYKPLMGLEIGSAILRAAHRRGLLDAASVPAYETWLAAVVDVIATYRGDTDQADDYLERLERVSRGRLPAPATDLPG